LKIAVLEPQQLTSGIRCFSVTEATASVIADE
jgi:hypothetical protein